jgi:hypothetical protein
MGTSFLRSDSDKWGQGLKWGQSESGDNLLFHHPDSDMNSLMFGFEPDFTQLFYLVFRPAFHPFPIYFSLFLGQIEVIGF